MMHKHSEQQNDRKWNSDQPKQYARFPNDMAACICAGEATRSGSIGSLQVSPQTVDRSTLVGGTARFVGRYAAAKADFYRPSRSPRTSRCRKTCHAFSLR